MYRLNYVDPQFTTPLNWLGAKLLCNEVIQRLWRENYTLKNSILQVSVDKGNIFCNIQIHFCGPKITNFQDPLCVCEHLGSLKCEDVKCGMLRHVGKHA